MSKIWLIGALHRYARKFPDESKVADSFLQFLRSSPDCFKRSLTEGHITGSAWLIDRAGVRVLLTQHRKLNIWVQLGGHADGNEDIFKVSHMEATEESGLSGLKPVSEEIFDLDIHKIPASKNEAEHLHYDVRFIWQATEDENFRVSDESKALAWVSAAQIPGYTTEASVLRMVSKWQRLLL